MKFAIPKTVSKTIDKIVNSNNAATVNIITLEGSHGAGKDVYASIIAARFKNSVIVRFADNAREDFRLAGISNTQLDILKRTDMRFPEGKIIGGWDVSNLTVRESLIKIAEGNKAKYGQYYYANLAVRDIQNALDVILERRAKVDEFLEENEVEGFLKLPTLNVIIPDLRFQPEIETLQALQAQGFDGQSIKVTSVILADEYQIGYDFYLPPITVQEVL